MADKEESSKRPSRSRSMVKKTTTSNSDVPSGPSSKDDGAGPSGSLERVECRQPSSQTVIADIATRMTDMGSGEQPRYESPEGRRRAIHNSCNTCGSGVSTINIFSISEVEIAVDLFGQGFSFSRRRQPGGNRPATTEGAEEAAVSGGPEKTDRALGLCRFLSLGFLVPAALAASAAGILLVFMFWGIVSILYNYNFWIKLMVNE